MTSSSALATVVVDELTRLGVTQVVLCPGSRSAPFAYALASADARGELTLHVRVDERSAAFLALGLARASGSPAAVVTTSGTAVANLHPAVLEASESGVGLLVLSADRPPELRGTRANQTTDQLKMFGGAVRWFHDLPCPGDLPLDHGAWRTAVDRAFAHAGGLIGARPGPVHLNVPLRAPLVDGIDAVQPGLAGRPDGRPWTDVPPREMSSTALPGHPRTLMVLGDLPDGRSEIALRVARQRGWPVVAEPFGTGRRDGVVPHGPLVLAAGDLPLALRPERILVVGRPTLDRAVARLLRTGRCRVDAVTTEPHWPDPSHVVQAVYDWTALTAQDGPGDEVDDDWVQAWSDVGRRLGDAVEPVISQSWPSGPAVAAAVLDAIPRHARLFAGSSNSARDLDVARGPTGPVVIGSRGLAGIDGNLSTAMGMALADTGSPMFALMGDLTFLHDTNGLLVGPAEPHADLSVVLVNDDGGGIFSTLEYGEPDRRAQLPGAFERVFATPTGARLADLCAAHGATHHLVDDRDDLVARLGRRPEGITVLEVAVPMAAHREIRARLREVAADAVGS